MGGKVITIESRYHKVVNLRVAELVADLVVYNAKKFDVMLDNDYLRMLDGKVTIFLTPSQIKKVLNTIYDGCDYVNYIHYADKAGIELIYRKDIDEAPEFIHTFPSREAAKWWIEINWNNYKSGIFQIFDVQAGNVIYEKNMETKEYIDEYR